MVLTDPMVDPRGGALTVGLGLVDKLAVVPHFGDEHDDAHGEKLERTVALAPAGLPVVGLPERTALIRDGDGPWRAERGGHAGRVRRRRPGPQGLAALRGRASARRGSVLSRSMVTDSDHDLLGRRARTRCRWRRWPHHVAARDDLAEERVQRREARPRRGR